MIKIKVSYDTIEELEAVSRAIKGSVIIKKMSKETRKGEQKNLYIDCTLNR